MYQCINVSPNPFHTYWIDPSANQRVASQDFDDVTGANSPSRCPLPGHLGPAERLSATLYTHYICTWNNFETRMELQIARVSLKWRYIDIDRISAPLKDIHCITQVAWSHDEDMLFDTNCSSFLIRTSSKSENPSLSEQRQRKIRKKHNIHYRDIYGCNIRLFSLQSNVHVCQYQISKS